MIRNGPGLYAVDLDELWPNLAGNRRAGAIAAPEERPHVPTKDTPEQQVDAVLESPNAAANAHEIPAPAQSRDWRQPLIWGGAGFVAGMLAWHVIGFWSFVSHVVWSDENTQRSAAAPHEAIVTGSLKEPRRKGGSFGAPTAVMDPSRCVVLAIDRTSGESKPSECSPAMEVLRDAGHRRRSDLAAKQPRIEDPAIWANTTAVEETTKETSAEAASIDESAFDLEIKYEQ